MAPVPAGYPIASQVEIRKAVVVRGATGNPEDVVLKMSGSDHRIVFMGNPRASLSAVTIHGGYINNNGTPYSKNGSGVCIGPTGGTLSNCVVRSCNIYTWGCEGAGIYVFAGADDALVTHCVVTNCTRATSSSGDRGVALVMYGGHVRNCLFAYNKVTASNSSQTHAMGTVFVGGGTLENCTVVKNDSYNCSGVYATGGEVRNCAIGLNTSSLISGNADYVVWAGTASCFSHCLAPVVINADCLQEAETRTYVAATDGDFTLAATSDGVNAAAAADWMAGATDLAGNPRIRGEAPDIGAYEADVDSLSATFSQTGATEGFPPFTAAFSADVANASGTQAFFWDWDGDGIFDEETSSPAAEPESSRVKSASPSAAGMATWRGIALVAEPVAGRSGQPEEAPETEPVAAESRREPALHTVRTRATVSPGSAKPSPSPEAESSMATSSTTKCGAAETTLVTGMVAKEATEPEEPSRA